MRPRPGNRRNGAVWLGLAGEAPPSLKSGPVNLRSLPFELLTALCYIAFAVQPFIHLNLLSATGLPEGESRVLFRDVTAASGVEFKHIRAATPEKYIVEVMGSGCAFVDYDRDGWLDVFLVNGGRVPGFKYEGHITHALYRNLGNGLFRDVTSNAGILESSLYGMGVAVGDYNNDGFDDLYLTYFGGANQLYQNNGDGTFADVTEQAGVGSGGHWSTSAAFFDYDRDGFLDLYVCRYLDFSFDKNRVCGPVAERGFRSYCSPEVYKGVSDLLFRNNRDGTFADVSSESGISAHVGKGLGVVGADLDEDGWPEIYVANDTDPNFLFRNRGDGTFQEIGLLAGVALGENGKPQSGMGIACGDYDSDGLFDLAVTNLDAPEYLAIYRNLGDLLFEDVSSRVDVVRESSKYVGFGVGFLDFDNDADQDLFVANGHIDDSIHRISPGSTFKQPKLLFENKGRFEEVAETHGNALARKELSRGVSLGDYDNDGDVDILVANSGERPALLRNDGWNGNNWLSVQLRGRRSNRNGIGAVLQLYAESGIQTVQLVGGGSYLSASNLAAHFGLGELTEVERLEVRWPAGTLDVLRGPIESNQHLILNEGDSNDAGQR